MSHQKLGWFGIARLGLVQAALGSIVVLTTSTMNRVMVVELALPAILPGALVGLHYATQLLRPAFGHGSDRGARRTPWLIAGMLVLAIGAIAAAGATALMGVSLTAGVLAAVLAFLLIGAGVGAAGTTLLALLATATDPAKRAGAAMVTWMMMIAGIVFTTICAGNLLDPYSPPRLIAVTAGVAMIAISVTLIALWRLEPADGHVVEARPAAPNATVSSFKRALADVWADHQARAFTIFVFVSMLAYSAQDLILEPFAGHVFGYTPGESTKLSGVQHAGVLVGMLLTGTLGTYAARRGVGSLRSWCIGGCIASAFALAGLSFGASAGDSWPLSANVFALGAANGAFAVAAIGSMMELASSGGERKEGIRVGLWGAAQGIAFGLGGLAGTASVDVARLLISEPASAYALVFAAEALLFIVSAVLAARLARREERAQGKPPIKASVAFQSGRG
ncbi:MULTISPECIES: BCD family MFS transporter [Hyphomicrobium]|jgi:BCD family chlorophyll transporter-like MFS transporter|uniref:BCD family MFS transporter n=1 Tax=Hyphomicrobium TaxID=81 RepID=UPI00036B0408|nr:MULTISPECIES: BCD family MFS transporter [Hyphomicrobium]WBT37015.1 BCD family MFS transporter [Hyphomicrobium sp. DMF-1]HML41562.1 BCD family MFS transporter [Hyphomicrobium zavarzinii]